MSKYGLSKEQIEESRRKYGDNTLTQPPRETFWSKLLGNFQDPIIRILIVALLVNAFFVYLGHGDWIETIGIFLAIILATFVSTWSEYSNENAFQKLVCFICNSFIKEIVHLFPWDKKSMVICFSYDYFIIFKCDVIVL